MKARHLQFDVEPQGISVLVDVDKKILGMGIADVTMDEAMPTFTLLPELRATFVGHEPEGFKRCAVARDAIVMCAKALSG